MGDLDTCSSDLDLRQIFDDQVLTYLIENLTLFKSDKESVIGLILLRYKSLFRKTHSIETDIII